MDEGFPGPSMRPASHKERAPINNIWSNISRFPMTGHFAARSCQIWKGTSPAWPARPAIIIRMLYHALVHDTSAKSTQVGTEKKSRNHIEQLESRSET
ncbi:hypothetical protein M0657_004152 [Pyricularia oryzae]|nr:hypothetical protein M0657_004152 [Pyricularia oryzae]KAI7926666.1 hypothetical protein M9X92_002680 [Pyricularia oryzae]